MCLKVIFLLSLIVYNIYCDNETTTELDLNQLMLDIQKNYTLADRFSADDDNQHFFNPKSPYKDALEALFGIGIRLQLLLEQSHPNEKNFLVSPLSVAVGVGQLMLGARGKLQRYLADLLVINGGDLIQQDQNEIPLMHIHRQLGGLLRDLQLRGHLQHFYTLETASALFLEPGLQLKQQFQRILDEIYNTDVIPMKFQTEPDQSLKKINNWVKVHTHGRITKLLPQALPTTSAAVLANAVYFKGDWELPFDVELTQNDHFHLTPNKTVAVDYLQGQLKLNYSHSSELNCSMIMLPYKGGNMSMYLLLPDKDNGNEFDIKQFTTKLRSNDIHRLMQHAKLVSVRVRIPKINLSNTLSLMGPLKHYQKYKDIIAQKPRLLSRFASRLSNRIDLILDDKIVFYKEIKDESSNLSQPVNINVGGEQEHIDWSGASDDPRFLLTEIIHQTSLAINEKGTEAAASFGGSLSLSGSYKDFLATRPFMFFIRDEITESILFWGTIVNPIG